MPPKASAVGPVMVTQPVATQPIITQPVGYTYPTVYSTGPYVRTVEVVPPPKPVSQSSGLIVGFAIGMLGALAILPFVARK